MRLIQKKPKLPRVSLPKQVGGPHKVKTKLNSRERKNERSPEQGSQEWAETYGDDLGESPDY